MSDFGESLTAAIEAAGEGVGREPQAGDSPGLLETIEEVLGVTPEDLSAAKEWLAEKLVGVARMVAGNPALGIPVLWAMFSPTTRTFVAAAVAADVLTREAGLDPDSRAFARRLATASRKSMEALLPEVSGGRGRTLTALLRRGGRLQLPHVLEELKAKILTGMGLAAAQGGPALPPEDWGWDHSTLSLSPFQAKAWKGEAFQAGFEAGIWKIRLSPLASAMARGEQVGGGKAAAALGVLQAHYWRTRKEDRTRYFKNWSGSSAADWAAAEAAHAGDSTSPFFWGGKLAIAAAMAEKKKKAEK